jgi:hypothetical protein
MTTEDKLAVDTQLIEAYLTGLQAEFEAKLRHVSRLRDDMQKIDAAARGAQRARQQRTARDLIRQVDEMLDTNLTVRDMLLELKTAAEAVSRVLEE